MKRLWIVLLTFMLLTSFIGCSTGDINNDFPSSDPNAGLAPSTDSIMPEDEFSDIIKESSEIPGGMPEEEKNLKPLEVHFLDVGQADCILIKTPRQKAILIDSGKNSDEDDVVFYIKSQGIDTIDAVVGTHPHEDHIGGLDAVISSFNIGKIYMPQVSHSTQTFEDVLNAIKNKGLKVTNAFAGTIIDVDTTLKIEMLAPNSQTYEDINNYSAVVKLTYNNISFLFTGDAESVLEQEMISKGYDLKANVLKVGHHGSATSTIAQFLKKVSPEYAVISVGKDNSYGHPDNLILNRLKTFGVEVFRTDESGTVIAISDGETIKFDKKASSIKEQAPPQERELSGSDSGKEANSLKDTTEKEGTAESKTETQEITVYITKTGDKYHSEGCQYLKKSKTPISLNDAKNKGYTPCSRCNPPQ